MSGPYENPQLLDEVCRAVMREKPTAEGCLLFIVYENKLAEVVTAFRDLGLDERTVAQFLRKAAEKCDALALRAKPERE